MKRSTRLMAPLAALGLPALASGAMLATASPAAAASGDSFQATLSQVNDSGASGMAWVTLNGDQATVKVNADGLVAGMPHAQHIHIGGKHVCPTSSADSNGDGVVSTVEGQPAYGAIKESLTTKGDHSPDSALAVKRFPTAPGGSESYARTFTVSSSVASQIRNGNAVIVVHGIDTNGNGKYDTDAGKSPLDKSLPLEATAPTMCGTVSAMPAGGVQTGGGSTAGTEDAGLFAVGGALVIAAGAGLGTIAYRRRVGARS
ncbi:MAG: CHRD domain-containing protein [Streptosporangiaceae bacterium]